MKLNLPEWVKRLMMWRWLYKAYYSCGSDVFCPTIYSQDYDYLLEISDGKVILNNQIGLDNPKITGTKSGHHTNKYRWDPIEEIGDLDWPLFVDFLLDKRNFTLEDMYIGLYDRIFPYPCERQDFPEVVQQMEEYMEDFIDTKIGRN